MKRPNNPRVFAEAISLDAWRTQYAGDKGDAQLHIDVVFSEGRIGGSDIPVRFRLKMRRAEVCVILDSGGVLKVPPASVRRIDPTSGTLSRSYRKSGVLEGSAGFEVSKQRLDGKLSAGSSGKLELLEEYKEGKNISSMVVTHRRTENGYAFVITPALSEKSLDGQPWKALEPILTLRDEKFPRLRGEPPEPRIEIHCRREDLLIEDIQVVGESINIWKNTSKNKLIAAEQYIKEELIRAGFPCGDLSNPYEEVIISDASPYVD